MTPIYHIKILGANIDCWAKLENRNPTGTHKDRSMGPWIEYYAKQGISEFAIGSSGNSAKSAAKVCKEMGCKLKIFVNSKTPKRDAFRYAKEHDIPNLRASIDDHALVGYKDIAKELVEQIPKIDNIFIPTSSGATLEGMYLGFKEKAQRIPAVYVVQTAKVHPIASYFDKDFKPEESSFAKAIVDRIAHRRDRVIKICQETNGGGFVISNKELAVAKSVLKKAGWRSQAPHGAWQSALAFAGFLKWKKRNPHAAKRSVSVCLFTD